MSTTGPRFIRPATPPGFDASRAAERAAAPAGWRYDRPTREAVHRVIAERRDIRRFRPDPVPEEVLERILAAAHRAPSVGLMQPWRLLVIRSLATRAAVAGLAQRERILQADRFDERTRHFLDQKIEGVVEAPLGVVVCCDHGRPETEVLGRGTIPETDLYSTACAVENLMLAARAEGIGVGWVSFYRPPDLRALLGIPLAVDPVAYLCLGWPDERPVRPGLEAAGWGARLPLAAVVMEERWTEPGEPAAGDENAPAATTEAPGLRRRAAARARDRLDALVKPSGSLGALEAVIERWAQITGAPPPAALRAGILIACADHGHAVHGTSLFDPAVSAQVAAAAARGETAAGVLAHGSGHRLLIADLGLVAETPPGVDGRWKLAAGSGDLLAGPALTPELLEGALAAGAALAREAAAGADCLVLGEIGIGNTTTSAALACALTGLPPERTVGRGTGVDAAGLARKRSLVAAALARAGFTAPTAPAEPDAPATPTTPTAPAAAAAEARRALVEVGGLELAALTGAVLAAAQDGVPVVLDGLATAAAALAAVRLDPRAREVLLAGHRSPEPGHGPLLAELGLEPLIDLRLRLGEASGAALALPLIAAAGALHAGMGTFLDSGVDGPAR